MVAVSLKVPVVAPAVAAAVAAKLPASAPAIAVTAASVPGVKVSDVRTAAIAAVPLQAAKIVAAFSQAKLTFAPGSAPWRFSRAPAAVSEKKGVL